MMSFHKNNNIQWLVWLIACLFFGCKNAGKAPDMFEALDSSHTSIEFSNQLQPTADFNLFRYMYYYNGAGVGAADFNNDGLTDLFFAANQGNNALYLNKGDLHFEEVTDRTGMPNDGAWSTGVSVVDINNDGLQDIYICRVGGYSILKGRNLLMVCTGIDDSGVPHYKEQAEKYGLDFSGFSTHAAFFDYDLDGDLDMFLLNHSVNHDGNYAPRSQFLGTIDSLAGQRLYRNDTRTNANGEISGRFSNVTEKAGINGSRIGYGLGVVVTDVNLDGLPDIYVGNDFHENDYLYINNGDGTFKEQGTVAMQHTSQFSMGVDAADINNDGFPEIVTMDMLPDDPEMLRRSLSEDDYNIFQHKIAYGYSYQYARNNLQLNLGNGYFSEIGQYAGIYATDWTWSALFFDFDNNGMRDLFVSNGIPKRMNDIDYINFVSGEEMQERLRNNTLQDKDIALISKFPEIKLPNQFFRNNGDLTFSEIGKQVNNNLPTFSNGAVYADLDNDGDLDIVVNNINDKALVYRNLTNGKQQGTLHASIRPVGPELNKGSIGTRLLMFANGSVQYHEMQPVRGFLSSMLIPFHAGLQGISVDSALVIWPDNSYMPIMIDSAGMQTVDYRPGLPKFDFSILHRRKQSNYSNRFEDITDSCGLMYAHTENNFNEFTREALLPRMVSTEGPSLAVADINGDSLDDIFIGASKGNVAGLFLQQDGGKFFLKDQPAFHRDSMWEHVDAQWADVNGDGFPDLVIATGGNEFYGNDEHLQPLLYLNDGKGNLNRRPDAFPEMYITQSRVLVSDFDRDGDSDLFISGRAVPWQYGLSPRSFLLQNDGSGKFSDATAKWCPPLEKPGMVSYADLADLNGDGRADLVLCYDWGGIDAFFAGEKNLKKQSLCGMEGWWQTLLPADIDGDGDTDLIAGNFGLNSRLRASEKQPVRLYLNDFDDNGRTEQVMTYYLKEQEINFSSKLQLEKQMPSLKKKFLYAADFSKASMADVFGKQKLEGSTVLKATQFAHLVLRNNGKGIFTAEPLTGIPQFSTVKTIIPVRSDSGSATEFLLAGNFFDYHIELGRQDAGYGVLLKGGNTILNDARIPAGNLFSGQVRRILPATIGGRKCLVLAKNNEKLRILRIR